MPPLSLGRGVLVGLHTDLAFTNRAFSGSKTPTSKFLSLEVGVLLPVNAG